MIRDFSIDPEPKVIDTDICIVGAGAAGITLSMELAQSGRRVLIVESGGFEFDGETQGLYEGESIGLPYWLLAATRLRFFGGTTNHWTGRCVPLSPWDFEARAWMPLSGWPIDYSEMAPYYRRARPYCELDGENWFDPASYTPEQFQLLETDPRRIATRMVQWSPPTRFGERFREPLTTSKVDLLLYANVTSIVADPHSDLVRGVRIASLSGAEGMVRAQAVVIACGGIENARLLLLSDDVRSGGIGNQHDLVGRHFMEHPHLIPAYGTFTGDIDWLHAYAGMNIGEASLTADLVVTSEGEAQEEINGFSASFYLDFDDTAGYPSLARLLKGESDEALEDVWNVVTDIDDAAVGGWRRLWGHGARRQLRHNSFGLFTITEQQPNPSSRVRLTRELDALGQRKVALDWRMTDADMRTVRIGCEMVGLELGRLGLGRLKLDDWLIAGGAWPEELWGGNHHMGTTRMSVSPREGVVDAECRVHGTRNLFVAGSSVFATSGAANPTLSIVALAIRLADHLKSAV